MSNSGPSEPLRAAADALASGDARKAFSALRTLFEYPSSMVVGSHAWRKALELLIEAVQDVSGPKLAAKLRDTETVGAAKAQTFFDAGYELVEGGFDGMAATFLSHANDVAPGEEGILSELVTALENAGLNHEARRVLESAPKELLDRSFLCAYLLAFDTLATGDVGMARERCKMLTPTDETQRWMRDNVRQMLLRAEGVSSSLRHDRLSNRDLRGWHFVMNGTLLLHISPFGFDEGMSGRYAFTQDSASRCREGVEKLLVICDALGQRPLRVLAMPDRQSRILAIAAAQKLGATLGAWDEAPEVPGLIVAYDLQETGLESAVLQKLQTHTAGQMLFAHASCWTQPFPLAPDLTTYLHQYNVSPWAKRTGFDRETREPIEHPADMRDEQVLANEVLCAALEPDALADITDLQTLAGVARALPEEAQPPLLRAGGRRIKQLSDSPVKSSRFT